MNTKNSYLAFIESNTTGTGKIFLERARQQGYEILFFTKDPDRYNFLQTDFIQPIILDTHDAQVILDYLQQFQNLVGVFSSSEYFIEQAAFLANQFNLPSNHHQDVSHCRNKNTLAKILTHHHISSPYTLSIDSIAELDTFIAQNKIVYPILVKPLCGSGSIGVKLCYNQNELQQHVGYLLNTQISATKNTGVLLQEYIEGDEYSVETLGLNQRIHFIGITKKYLHDLPNFIESGHDFPAILSKEMQQKIYDEVSKALTALNLIWGPIHTEVRIKNNIPYIIEVNPRLAGGMIPQLIHQSFDFDIIDATIKLITGSDISIDLNHKKFSSIRFLIPQESGIIKNILFPYQQDPAVVEFHLNKSTQETINLSGDFKDRIGYFIVTDIDQNKCKKIADRMIKSTSIQIETNVEEKLPIGRLNASLNEEVKQLIQEESTFYNRKDELTLLAQIDEVHIMMLHQNQYISKEIASKLLQTIQDLKDDSFENLLKKTSHRGTYILYETYLIEALGIEIAGNIHIARSRNDINATLFQLQLRKHFLSIYEELWQLRSVVTNQASKFLKSSFPIYSQYQIALPSTFGHYLLGIGNALTRDQAALQSLYSYFDYSPLGACAGGGTTLPIDQAFTTNLLGFKSYNRNSLDAVASRDLALRMLASLDICAITLSRFVTDLQLWITNEFDYIELSDDLVGTSSMLPQKKNPYLLEKIRGRLSKLSGYYIAAATTMHKVSFANSVEISTESIKTLLPAFDDILSAIKLLKIILKNINLKLPKTRYSQIDHLAMATYVTDILIKEGRYSFREAHTIVSHKIKEALQQDINPYEMLSSISESIKNINFEPLEIALKMEYGGGPGEHSTLAQYNLAIAMLNQDSKWLIQQHEFIKQADLLRKKFRRNTYNFAT